MTRTAYRKFISKEIIEESKYPQITTPIVKYRGDRGGRDLTFEWSCITKPLVMDDETNVNEFDQYLLFVGSNINDLKEFQAEIELTLGKEGEKQIIDEPKFVYIPKGLVHGPIKFKKINKPVVLMNIYLSPKYSIDWVASDYGKYLANPDISSHLNYLKVTHENGVPFREQKVSQDTLLAWCEPLGLGGKICMGYSVIKKPNVAWEPVHYHKYLDEWIVFLGGAPTNVEEFDAETEMWWGKEREKQVLDSTCVCHIPPKMIHCSNDHRRVGKPYVEIVINAPTGEYFKEKDKVVLSKGEDGEVIISEGALDWVPVSEE